MNEVELCGDCLSLLGSLSDLEVCGTTSWIESNKRSQILEGPTLVEYSVDVFWLNEEVLVFGSVKVEALLIEAEPVTQFLFLPDRISSKEEVTMVL